MYLSRMTLNPQRRGTRTLRSNPQAMHAAVLSAFPPGREARPLWRLDEDGRSPELLLASMSKPSFEHLQEQAGWSGQPTWETREYGPLLDRLQRGQRYAFRLVANPSHVAEVNPGIKRRVGHVSPAHQLRWLLERQERLGISIPTVEVEGTDTSPGDGGDVYGEPAVRLAARRRVEFRHGDRPITLVQARYDGLLEVADAAALREALTAGVGRGKAYGCGLLTLASPDW
ncbi:CRISPR-associated endoribonuclease Cse3 [Pseudoclavibacter triregionum]|nr:CRISPR-associated endoribonuclease Cse3 [Pseudoclavibacter triregionum]